MSNDPVRLETTVWPSGRPAGDHSVILVLSHSKEQLTAYSETHSNPLAAAACLDSLVHPLHFR